jgi:hypothetical protein
VDNTVRRNLWHSLTGSRWFPFESSSYKIRTVQEIITALRKAHCVIVDRFTTLNANLWHDRSFILAAVGSSRQGFECVDARAEDRNICDFLIEGVTSAGACARANTEALHQLMP